MYVRSVYNISLFQRWLIVKELQTDSNNLNNLLRGKQYT